MQGILPIQLLFTKIRPENNSKFSSLRANSLRDNAAPQGIIPRAQGIISLFST
jgi:hypothetical protein